MRKVNLFILLILFFTSVLKGNVNSFNKITFSIFDSINKSENSNTSQNFVFSPISVIKTLNDFYSFTKGKTNRELAHYKLDISDLPISNFFELNSFLFYYSDLKISSKIKNKSNFYGIKNFSPNYFPEDEILWENGITKEILDSVTSNTVLRYVLSTKFKANWVSTFKAEKKDKFNTPTKKIDSDFITDIKSADFYINSKNFEMASLSLGDNTYEIIFIKVKDLKSLKKFSITDYKKTLEILSPRQVHFVIPKFDIKTKNNYIDIFNNLNIKFLFMPSFDYTIFEDFKDSICVDLLQSNDSIRLDKEGIDAKTNIFADMTILRGDPQNAEIEFRLDSPFLFIIREKKTKYIIYMGKIEDPTEN